MFEITPKSYISDRFYGLKNLLASINFFMILYWVSVLFAILPISMERLVIPDEPDALDGLNELTLLFCCDCDA